MGFIDENQIRPKTVYTNLLPKAQLREATCVAQIRRVIAVVSAGWNYTPACWAQWAEKKEWNMKKLQFLEPTMPIINIKLEIIVATLICILLALLFEIMWKKYLFHNDVYLESQIPNLS